MSGAPHHIVADGNTACLDLHKPPRCRDQYEPARYIHARRHYIFLVQEELQLHEPWPDAVVVAPAHPRAAYLINGGGTTLPAPPSVPRLGAPTDIPRQTGA